MTRRSIDMDVWTARISTRDPDALNITRKSGLAAFAPSWRLLRTMLEIRRAGREPTDEEWLTYAQSYLREMKTSLQTEPKAWEALLACTRVVLTCYCTNPARCHRTVLGLFLTRHGANFHGELVEEAEQKDLFQLAMGLE